MGAFSLCTAIAEDRLSMKLKLPQDTNLMLQLLRFTAQAMRLSNSLVSLGLRFRHRRAEVPVLCGKGASMRFCSAAGGSRWYLAAAAAAAGLLRFLLMMLLLIMLRLQLLLWHCVVRRAAWAAAARHGLGMLPPAWSTRAAVIAVLITAVRTAAARLGCGCTDGVLCCRVWCGGTRCTRGLLPPLQLRLQHRRWACPQVQ